MGSSSLVQQKYRKCLERDFRRGHSGVCTDLALREWLRQHLLADPELHYALRDDVFATLASSLRGWDALPLALRGLARAFEVLELAAVNLHLLPWRKEFSTIKMFSGVYVHSLQAALSDSDIAKSFHRMGYVKRDDHHLVVSQPPPGAELVQAACGFFAARVECEILGEILWQLEPCQVSAEDLLQVRRGTRDLHDCVEKLQRLARWPKGREPRAKAAPGCAESIDLYGDELQSPEAATLYSEPMGARLQSPPWALSSRELHRPPIWEQSPTLWGEAVGVPGPEDLGGNEGRIWENRGTSESGQEQPYRNGPNSEAAAFSFISLRGELSKISDSVSPETTGSTTPSLSSPSDTAVLKPHAAASCLMPRSAGKVMLSECRTARFLPMATETPWELLPAAPRLESREREVLESPCYQLHSCLIRGALPSYCCATCCLLHASGCDAMQTCRSSHCMQELQSEQQKLLWLRRTQVDMLLKEGSGAQP
ncbi:spermatogenesis-associated protein 2-like protein [Mauremys reevesii]|uniref:spermatogenesis-associated protein 2-like protein n=1 Tax=Mauremys reevesii TaxID=260615 RepID=UPI00193F2D6A|nr:spermatogenesis-associated protein 2-like protein [Mauremys reevesii]XP_039359482.1 spermatogenesis-associated protein 2-like protein [Mauremys reevesii]